MIKTSSVGRINMAAVGLDSEAAFKHRALEVGMEEAYFQTLKAAGVSTYGKLAFVCGYTLDKVTRRCCLMQLSFW